ncbi:MAG: hypothetical protein ACK5KN_13155 [Dysgonomonas sp.]
MFLLPKAAKGTKNALAPRFKGRPVTDKKTKRKNSLERLYNPNQRISSNTFPFFSSFHPTGTPSMKLTAQADALIPICVSLRALVTQAGYPHGADGVELTIAEAKARQMDGAIARLSLSAGKTVVAPSPFGEGGG